MDQRGSRHRKNWHVAFFAIARSLVAELFSTSGANERNAAAHAALQCTRKKAVTAESRRHLSFASYTMPECPDTRELVRQAYSLDTLHPL